VKEERIDKLQGSLEEMQRHPAQVSEVLAMNPTVAQVERALARKRVAAP